MEYLTARRAERRITMCNFSNNNQSNQSAKSIIDQQAQATATATDIMKKIAEECAIKDSEKSGLYSPIPMSINIVIGDFNIFCNNEAYRSKAKPKKRGAKRIINAPTPDVASHNAPTTINQQSENEEISGSKLYGMLTDALTPDEGAIVKFSFEYGYLQLKTTKDFFKPTQAGINEMLVGLRRETGDNKIMLTSVDYIKIHMGNMPKVYWYAIYKKLRTKFGPYQVRIYL